MTRYHFLALLLMLLMSPLIAIGFMVGVLRMLTGIGFNMGEEAIEQGWSRLQSKVNRQLSKGDTK